MDKTMTFDWHPAHNENGTLVETSSTVRRLWLTSIRGYRVVRSTKEPRAGLTGIHYKHHWLLERKQ